MKNIPLIVLVSVVSALSAVAAYKYFEEPRTIVVRERVPVKYTNFQADNHLMPAGEESEAGEKKRRDNSARPADFTSAAEVVMPAVANIKAIQSTFDFWSSSSYGNSSGSGVIISADGYIVTNAHVIEDASKIEVTLYDKREFDARLIGVDLNTDLALIQIDEEGLPHLNFGNSDMVKVGEWVLAVGNPFNLESTVTAGIVSAKGRNINILEGSSSIESFIQTDAAVNPGNSGGALVNTKGELVGINTAIITRSGRYEGYSFAIPANLAVKIIRDLRDFGVVQRGYLGVNIGEVNEELAEELELPSVEGVYITNVNKGSGAEDAGIQKGDVIIRINGQNTSTVPELQEQVARYRPGNVLSIDFIREGQSLSAEVTLKNNRNSTQLLSASLDNEIDQKLGFELRSLTRMEERELKVSGVKVRSIFKNSIIEATNMEPGFIITKINNKQVEDVEALIRELNIADPNITLEGVYPEYPGKYYYEFSK